MKRRDFFKTMGLAGVVAGCELEQLYGEERPTGWFGCPVDLIDKFTLDLGEERSFSLQDQEYVVRLDGVYLVGDGTPAIDLTINDDVKTYLLGRLDSQKLEAGAVTEDFVRDGQLKIAEVYDINAKLREPSIDISIYQNKSDCEYGDEGDSE